MDVFSYNIYSHPIDTYQETYFEDCLDMRVTMSGHSGYERVAWKAVADVRRKDYLKRVCESDAEFKHMWKMECRKKEEKKRAMQEGTWKTQLNRVSFGGDVAINNQNTPISVKKGRFLITMYSEKKSPERFVSVKKGRFLIKYMLCNKQEQQKKPTTLKKGRFLITIH